MLFCFVIGNSDMHLKNFSLIEEAPGSRKFMLSPAYDLLPVNVILPADKEQMALALNGRKRNIRKKDFLVLAQSYRINDKAAIRLMERVVKSKDLFIDMTRDSYLSSGYKESLINLIEDRCEVLNQ
ncbi:HipA domain-containing protein [Butyrivibrio sp. WCD2001]|uniref:HipA domain-containing protein n=1 Tax=Butyrivibrio sp. WCD2001 TaxID=1280681 RepID=UPI0012DCFE75|nr:HipA domain-containing protein [Butyrivibrio sp. WCD2001]